MLAVAGYEILGVVGRGGMGVVYKARHLALKRTVALKMILAGGLAGPSDLARFRVEALAIARLQHPNIVQIHEIGEADGQPYCALEFVEGSSLAQKLVGGPLPLKDAARLVEALARAMQLAHSRNVVHRDLKPANVLLTAEGTPKVSDFGLARRLDSDSGETQSGAVLGTPSYMAPEQASGRTHEAGPAADVYALGGILYACLTGRPPFRGATMLETLDQVRIQEPVPPSRWRARVSPDLEKVCLKCLRKEPEKRYASAAELADELGRFLRGEPVQARPVGPLDRAAKWVRRHKGLSAGLGAAVLTLLAGLAGVCWQWQRADHESVVAQRTAYARGISLAYAEWLAGNAGRASQLLSECGHELRGWEWCYLQRLFQVRQLAPLPGHRASVLAVAFSPDGARVASAGADGTVMIWDRLALRETLTLGGHADKVTALSFNPDGKTLASGSADGAVCIWHAASGQRLAAFQGHAGRVTGLAFDPAGRRLASAGEQERSSGLLPTGELKTWDPTTGKALACRGLQDLLTAVAFSPNGKYLVAAGFLLTAFDAATLTRVPTFEGERHRAVQRHMPGASSPPWTCVAFSADGKWLAAGSSAGLVRAWDAATDLELFAQHTPGRAGVSGLTFCGPDGRILAAATADNTVQAWYTRSGKPAFALRGHTRAVKAVACSPDGRCLASGGEDQTLKLWDLSRRDDDLTLRPANEGVTGVVFSPNGKNLASATRDKVLKVWDMTTGKWTLTLRRLPWVVNGLAFRPGGQLAGACGDGKVRVWEIPSGRERLCLDSSAPLHAVAFSPNGGALAGAAGDGTVRVWEFPSGRESLCLRGAGPVHTLAFNPDGTRLAAAGREGVARIWDATTGQEIGALRGHGGQVHAVAFSPDGRHLSTASQDGAIRVWDARTGEWIQTLRGHAGAVRSLAYGREGRLASAGDDRAVRVWDPAGRELLALRGHTETLRAITFSADGHRLASASDDGTIKVWDGTPLQR
jgi:WD40 repeat protein